MPSAPKAIADRGVIGLARGALALAIGMMQARQLLLKLRPAAVVGFGGYASAPTMAAAVQLGLPTIIHEQNAILGRANRLLASRVDRVCTSFDLAQARAQRNVAVGAHRHAGAPGHRRGARHDLYARPDGPFRILVLGGSQGARVFSDVIPAAVRAAARCAAPAASRSPSSAGPKTSTAPMRRLRRRRRACAAAGVLRQRARTAGGHPLADRAVRRLDRRRSRHKRPAQPAGALSLRRRRSPGRQRPGAGGTAAAG